MLIFKHSALSKPAGGTMISSQNQGTILKSYQKPSLTEFGKVEQLTQGGAGTKSDGGRTRRR